MNTDKLWTAINDIERQLINLKGELINIDEEITQSDEAYQRGYDKGYADKTNNDEVCKELAKDIYQRGLNAAWEAAKKLSWTEKYGGYGECLDKVFERTDTFDFFEYSPNEAIEKLKAYEKQKADDEIKVGDEVEVMKRGIKFFVTKIYEKEGTLGGINKDGEVRFWPRSLVKRTGNHFDIDKILEEMQT